MFETMLGFALWHLRRDFSVRDTEALLRDRFANASPEMVRDALFWAVQGRLKPGELEIDTNPQLRDIFRGNFAADRFRIQAIVTMIIDGEEQTRIVSGVVPSHFTQLEIRAFLRNAAEHWINQNYPGQAGTGIEITGIDLDVIVPLTERFS